MQSVATINQQWIEGHTARSRTVNEAAKRLLLRVFICWRHDLSRPFSRRGRTYRACVKCGMARDFNPVTWTTHGPTYRLPVDMDSGSPTSVRRNAA